MGGGVYRKTIAKLVETNNDGNLQNKLDNYDRKISVYDNHLSDKNNPHELTLSKLGFDQNQLKKEVINVIYPVNSIIMTYINENPGNHLSGTKWELISQGKYITGASNGSSSAFTGGRESVNLSHKHNTVSHSHSIDSHSHSIEGHTHSVPAHNHLQTFGADEARFYYYYPPSSGSGASNHKPSTVVLDICRGDRAHSSGGYAPARFNYTENCDQLLSGSSGTLHTSSKSLTTNSSSPDTGNSMGDVTLNPPYLAVFIWRRIA